MNKKVNNTSERLPLSNTILSEAQCGDSLDELMTAWQQHSDRIEQIAGQHDLSHIKLAPRLLVLSSRRRRILSSLAMTLVCLAAIVGMVILRQHFISDIFDQLFFVFLALLMVVTLIQSLRQIFLLRRQPLLNSQFSILTSSTSLHFGKESKLSLRSTFGTPNSQFSILSRAAVFASVVVMFLFLAVPVQNGRAMSHGSPSHRSAALTSVSSVLSHIQ